MTRVDLHCHSTASAVAKLGVQQALGLPECATPPAEVHALARRRGMDFVTTDTFGQVVLEAQASGLPVVAVAAGGPAELIEDGRSGVLCPAEPAALGAAVAALAAAPRLRERLAAGGLAAVRDRTWDAALGRLGDGWRRGLAGAGAATGREAA